MTTTKRLFIVVVYTLLAFLLYEETRARAIGEARLQCKLAGLEVQGVESHDVTLEDDSFRRIENILSKEKSMKLRKCPSRSTAGAVRLVEEIFQKYPQAAMQEAGPSISSVVKECQRLNPGLTHTEVYEAITAVGPSDGEVQEYDNAQH